MLLASSAAADPADDAVSALRSASVYVGAKTPTIDKSAVGDLAGIKVAVMPTGGPDPVAVAREIGGRLDPDGNGLTVLVFEGRSYGAASSAYCGVGTVLNEVVDRERPHLRATDDVTSTVSEFATAVRQQPNASNGCSGSQPSSSFGTDAKKSSHTELIVFLIVALIIIAAVAFFVASHRRRREQDMSDARSQVLPYYQRLAHDVSTIDPGDNAAARQAMADAAERLQSAKGQLAEASSDEQYAQARLTVLQGLYSTRSARGMLGLDPGPDLPPLADGAGQLRGPREVSVQGQTYQGYPAYSSASPYYFGGGYGIPGGWYSFPFWETLLVGGLLAGSFGGFGGWGGYGAGFDNGYLTGYEAGENADDSAADSGADGGWDSGWGDSGGGGDWGGGDFGGGGDWGGGSDSGGSW
jgi:uncharacterized membrane protein YgcG